ncbi:MAG: hypothetical protein J7L82_03615 [Staphylothermus sp.]|nr:hypothetical protein [Staphylothermus sp.]
MNDLFTKILTLSITLLILIQFNLGIPIAYVADHTLSNKVYVVKGEYLGYITLEASGKYAEEYLSENATILENYVVLNIFYLIEINITLYQDSIYYDFTYRLTDYNIRAENIKENITDIIERELMVQINKTIYEHNNRVDPNILLNISNNRLSFQKIRFLEQNIAGITIFDDVYCYEIRRAIKIEDENTTFAVITSQYREILTYTPLYFYKTIYIGSLFPETNYYKLRILIINHGIGEQLSSVILTNSTIFYMRNDMAMGKIGYIALNMSSTNITSKILFNDDGIIYEIDSNAPYRVLLLLNKEHSITYSNIELQEFNSTGLKLYLSPVMSKPYEFIIRLNEKPLFVNDSDDVVGLDGITLEERKQPSPADIILTIVADITILGLVLLLGKIINDKF